MKGHWVVHMKNGFDLHLNEEGTYVTTLENTNLVAIKTNEYGTALAVVPPENILWLEYIIKE